MLETIAGKEDRSIGRKKYGFTNVPWCTTEVEALSNYRLRVKFVDGVEGVVEMREQIFSEHAGVFRALEDPAEFAKG